MHFKHFIRFTIHNATKLMPPMLRRLFIVFLPSLTASVSYANEASWNCEQNKDSKEWICVGDKKSAIKTSAVTTPVTPEPAKAEQPDLNEPFENTPPVAAKSAEHSPTASAQVTPPVVTEAVKSTQPPLSASQKTTIDSNKIIDQEAKNTGGNCGSNKVAESRDCQSVAPNTESNAEIAAESPMMRLLSPAFDRQQEQTFKTLTSQLSYDPWENCNMKQRGTKRDFVSQADKRETSPMDIKSNYAEVFDGEIRNFVGNVKMSRADQQSSSRTANYDSVSQVLDMHGNVYYREDALALHSETAMLNLASDQAKLRNVQFIAPETPLRGMAKSYNRQSKTLSQYQDVAYTSCRPGNQDWVIHTPELKMNKTTGKGTAKNAWMEFKGAPVFYTPYISFPIDNRRLSGFLAPSFGSTKYGGFRIAAPYYWNIAPNYDATLIPRELTTRGPLLASKFRYLTEQSSGNVAFEFMPHDSVLNTTRYLGSIKNTSRITPHISSNMDLNYASDKTYFAELGNALSFSNYNYLRSFANLNYAGDGVSLSGLVDNYQSINTTIVDAALPYRKLPQINLNLNHSFQFMPLNTAMENEYVYFQQASLVNGQRINTKPSISIPLQTASSFITPKLSVQHTQYALNNLQPGSSSSSSASRTLPIFSTDSGLFFERNLNIANTSFVHTLEPRLFYLYVPYTNQQNIPVFDSALYDFQYYSMFRENSFSGSDRIQDANQITTAITSRLIDDTSGLERLKLNIGEIFYFRDRNVTLQYAGTTTQIPGSTTVPTGNYSNLVTELSSELTHDLSLTSGLQWNPQQYTVQQSTTVKEPFNVNAGIQRINAGIHYSNPANEIFNIGYLYRKNPLIPDQTNDIKQSDMSFRYPIYDNWSAMGRWQYSLLYNKTQDALFGVEKENCCWRFRIALRHYINNLSNVNSSLIGTSTNLALTGTAQNGIFFEVELKGLSALGDDMDTFLQREIYGYRKSQQ